jgi:hypothetical protein
MAKLIHHPEQVPFRQWSGQCQYGEIRGNTVSQCTMRTHGLYCMAHEAMVGEAIGSLLKEFEY